MSCHPRRQRVIALLFLLLGASADDVTLYEWPYYKGRAYTLAPNETTTTNVPFRDSIQSIRLTDDVNLVTYDQADRRGGNATWYRSVVYTGKWVKRIFSFEVRNATALPTPPPGTIEAPWRFLGTWEGFMMVRFAAKSSHPECYAVNGVDCLLGANVDDLLPLLDAYESNRTSGNNDTSLSTFPAPCGPARQEHWGNDGYSGSNDWCWAAKQGLQRFDGRSPPFTCASGNIEIVGTTAVTETSDRARCVTSTDRAEGRCHRFESAASCAACAERLLFDISYYYGFKPCGNNAFDCVNFTWSSSATRARDVFLAICVCFVLCLLLWVYVIRKRKAKLLLIHPYLDVIRSANNGGMSSSSIDYYRLVEPSTRPYLS